MKHIFLQPIPLIMLLHGLKNHLERKNPTMTPLVAEGIVFEIKTNAGLNVTSVAGFCGHEGEK